MGSGFVFQSFQMNKTTDILVIQSPQCKLGSHVIFMECCVVKGLFML